MNVASGKLFLLLVLLLALTIPGLAQNDLPSPAANLEQLKNGSLIVAMDTNYQKNPGYFNLKAYGLVNEILQNEIPVKWVIKAGKNRTAAGSIDFNANTTRVFPDTAAMGTIGFRCGAFIIDSSWVGKAIPVITGYGNNVNVFKLNSAITADVRYSITHKPRILLLNSMGYDTIAVKALQEAGISSSSYSFLNPQGTSFNPAGNWSLISETHMETYDTAVTLPIIRYAVQRGANLHLSCTTIGAIENSSFTMTTAGIDSFSTGLAATAYLNADLPVAQFQGGIATPNGNYKLWKPKTGSSMRSNTYEFMRGGGGAMLYTMAGMKSRPNSLAGGNIFYVSGHEHYQWTNGSGTINDNNRINGRRIFLNTIFIPASDSIEGIDFKTDVSISLFVQPGFAVKYEPFKMYVVVKNTGPGTARTLNVNTLLPLGLMYSNHTLTNGSFNQLSGIWTLDSLRKNQSDTLTITAIINTLGLVSYSTSVNTSSLEYNKLNNSASINIFCVSRPNATNDTLHFTAPLFTDYPVKNNDSDEDGGPFASTAILAGPFNGTAQLLNGDSIRYTISSGFTGIDSLQYVTCDNYPLCDTAWFFIYISSPLPVSLINFSGDRSNEDVVLRWITLSEKNNDRFEIERSFDGYHFEKRGQVNGRGTTMTPSYYSFKETDNQEEILYYRLRQIDYDGTASLSNMIALPKRSSKIFNAEIYPNPGNGTLSVIKAEGIAGDLNMTICDLRGRIVANKVWTADDNGFVLALIDNKQPLSPGCYIAIFRSGEKSLSVKLMVH